MRGTLRLATVSCLLLGIGWYADAGTLDNGPWPYGTDATLTRPAHVHEAPAMQRAETQPKDEPGLLRAEPKPLRTTAVTGWGPWPYGSDGRLTATPEERVIRQGVAGEPETESERQTPAATCVPAGCGEASTSCGAQSACCGTCTE